MGKWIWILMIVAMTGRLATLPKGNGVELLGRIRAESYFYMGHYYLDVLGDRAVIDYICSFGDCEQSFESRRSAIDYWTQLYGTAYGLPIIPIPGG